MKPRLLFISHSGPFPPRDGKRQRSLAMLLAALQAYEVDYLILGNQPEYEESITHSLPGLQFYFLFNVRSGSLLKKMGLSFVPNLENRRQILDFLEGKNYSKILCRYALAAKDLPPIPHVLIDVDDDYSELMQSKISGQNSPFRKARYWQIFLMNRWFYFRILRKASRLILVNHQKTPYKSTKLPNLPFQLMMQDLDKPGAPSSRAILFLGKLSYAPNSEGISWFLSTIWPDLYDSIPEISLTLISSVSPDSDLEEVIRKSAGVNLQINVENLAKAYGQHALCIVPIFFGGGSNVKLAEALFMGRKVVSSQFGAIGFEEWVESGVVLLATTPEDWKLKIENLLVEPWRAGDFDGVRQNFSLENWNSQLIKILDEA